MWKQRNKALDKIGSQAEKEMLKAYSGSLKEIRATLGKYYQNYDMTMDEMQKFDRLKNLEAEVTKAYLQTSGKSEEIIRNQLTNQYTEGYYRAAFIAEKEVGVNLSYTMLNQDSIHRALTNRISGLAWTERMGVNRTEAVVQIRQSIARGLIQGESYKDMANRIGERLEVDMNKSLRIARTEGHRVVEESSYDSLKHAEEEGVIAKKMWVASIDSSTRDSHADLDGETVGIDEPFSNGLMYPGEASGEPEEIINCRCTTVTVFEGMEPSVRRIGGEMTEYKTYREWESKLK